MNGGVQDCTRGKRSPRPHHKVTSRCNRLEILKRHIRLFHQHATLVTTDTGLSAQPSLTMDTVSHNTYINQMWIRKSSIDIENRPIVTTTLLNLCLKCENFIYASCDQTHRTYHLCRIVQFLRQHKSYSHHYG